MEKKTGFFLKRPVLSITLWCAVVAATVFRALRGYWVFYDPNIAFLGGSTGVFVLSLIVIALLIALLALRIYAPDKCEKYRKACTITTIICFSLTALMFVADAVIIIAGGSETMGAFWLVLKKDLPPVIGVSAVLILLLYWQVLRAKGNAVLAVCMAACIGFSALWMIFPLKSYKIVSDPVVMDTGESYAVVFATNDTGIGYVRYTYEGEEHTVYAQKSGRRIADRRIFSIEVPYEHLKNNSYEIGSVRVIEQYAYGSRLGKDVNAGPYTLQVNESDTQSYLCISDWHSHLKQAKQAIDTLGAYDAVIMLGDPNTGMDYEEQAIEFVVAFGGDITHGAMPVIYVRGNHETRGAFAALFPEYIGYEQLYYTVRRGEYSFVILDSGEDKEDAHIEYGGLDEYAKNRAAMLDWLKTKPPVSDKTMVLSHAWQISEPEPKVSRAAWDSLQQMGARFMISGHTHTCGFLEEAKVGETDYTKAYPSISTYIDGGYKDGVYTASKLTLSPAGVQFAAANDRGETVLEKNLPW